MAERKLRRPRVLLVDDHEIVRLGLRAVLERAGMNVVAEAADGREALRAVEAARPQVILMDVRLPDRSGVELCREIRSAHPEIKILFLTAFNDEEALIATVFASADGYLLKEIGSDNLVEAIRMVASGLTVMKPDVNRSVVQRLQALSVGPSVGGADLSPQERRVLALVAEGKTNKEIGAAMKLSPKTVKNYLSRVFQKLQVTRRSEAVSRVMQEAAQYGRSSPSV